MKNKILSGILCAFSVFATASSRADSLTSPSNVTCPVRSPSSQFGYETEIDKAAQTITITYEQGSAPLFNNPNDGEWQIKTILGFKKKESLASLKLQFKLSDCQTHTDEPTYLWCNGRPDVTAKYLERGQKAPNWKLRVLKERHMMVLSYSIREQPESETSAVGLSSLLRVYNNPPIEDVYTDTHVLFDSKSCRM